MVDRELMSEPTQIHRPNDLDFAFKQSRSSIGPKDNGPKDNFTTQRTPTTISPDSFHAALRSVMVAGATLKLGHRY
jgi:hypothetical protein